MPEIIKSKKRDRHVSTKYKNLNDDEDDDFNLDNLIKSREDGSHIKIAKYDENEINDEDDVNDELLSNLSDDVEPEPLTMSESSDEDIDDEDIDDEDIDDDEDEDEDDSEEEEETNSNMYIDSNGDKIGEEEKEKEDEDVVEKVTNIGEGIEEDNLDKSATFEGLGLSPWLVDSLENISFTKPSEIQRACIPEILKGKDVVGSAKTGSGKTAAFALPILEKIAVDPYGPFALVLTPTRELAFQIAEQFRIFGVGINVKLSIIVGGMDMMAQALELSKRPHVIIATPGRLADHIQSSSSAVYLKRLKYVVLDEADRLLDSTFMDDLSIILKELPAKRQTLLFSATMTEDIEQIVAHKNPFVYHCATRYDTVNQLDQKYVFIPSTVKEAYLTWILRNECKNKSMIIFTGKCKTCEYLSILLQELGFKTTALNSKMTQNERLSSIARFKSGLVPILLTTDVGSRGLDIPSVQVVINYDIPADATDYIHRIGRTARAGRRGVSVSLISEHDVDVFLNIEKKTNKKMNEIKISEKEILELLNETSKAKCVYSVVMNGKKKR